MRARLEQKLAAGHDDALLRFSLGTACLNEGDSESAARHLERATEQNPSYSAAWKSLGKALLKEGRESDAAAAWKTGIEVARGQGEIQAAREMSVFLKRAMRRVNRPPSSMKAGSSRR
jgi:Flp pilus assembly protein TadD